MSKGRAKNLSDEAIGLIVGMLDGWKGKLTWNLLVDAIEKRLFVRYTRQALDKQVRIKCAYQLTKRKAGVVMGFEHDKQLSTAEVGMLTQRVNRIEDENARLKVENERLLEQFVTWAYNAHLKGLTKEQLNACLPRVDRELTKVSVGGKGNSYKE